MNPESLIQNHEAVVKHFGYWPVFHDAKVCAYEAPKAPAQSFSFTLHACHMTDDVDSKGYYTLKNHALISFRFDGVYDVDMDAFSSANILFGMELCAGPEPGSIRVLLDSVMNKSGSFTARSGDVVSVVPCSGSGDVNV